MVEGSKRMKDTALVESKTQEERKKQAMLHGVSSSKNQYHKITAQSGQESHEKQIISLWMVRRIRPRSFPYVPIEKTPHRCFDCLK